MHKPPLFYCGYGYGKHVTLDVLETILDRDGVRAAVPNILRDTQPPVLNNTRIPTLARKDAK